jgi:hypothetical protein
MRQCYLFLAISFLGLAAAQTFVTPSQVGTVMSPTQVTGIPNLWSQYGFMCVGVPPNGLNCQIDTAYILHLEPVPWNGSNNAPSPGACPSTGSVIVTGFPDNAVYFCSHTLQGAPNLNWLRVPAQTSW